MVFNKIAHLLSQNQVRELKYKVPSSARMAHRYLYCVSEQHLQIPSTVLVVRTESWNHSSLHY